MGCDLESYADSAGLVRAIWRTLSAKSGFGNAYNFTVKDFQPFDQPGHFSAEQFRQADVEAKRVAESVFENDACPVCICHFAPAPANAASDSARCSRTASAVKREIGRPRVVLVCGELNRTIDSILCGISFKTPTYLPPPAATIDEISVSPRARAGPVSIFSFRRCMESFILFQTASLSCLFRQACFRLVAKKGDSHMFFAVLPSCPRQFDNKKRPGTHGSNDSKGSP